jgi:hypothetical protein
MSTVVSALAAIGEALKSGPTVPRLRRSCVAADGRYLVEEATKEKAGINREGLYQHARLASYSLVEPLYSLILMIRKVMAESEGFEPPIDLRLCLISSQVHSTGLCQLSVL